MEFLISKAKYLDVFGNTKIYYIGREGSHFFYIMMYWQKLSSFNIIYSVTIDCK